MLGKVGTMLLVAGYFTGHVSVAHIGYEGSIGRGTNNVERLKLIEMTIKTWVGSLVQKIEQP